MIKRQTYTEKIDNLHDAIASALDVFSVYLHTNIKVLKVSIDHEQKLADTMYKDHLVIKIPSCLGDCFLRVDSFVFDSFLDMLGFEGSASMDIIFSDEYYSYFSDIFQNFGMNLATFSGMKGKIHFGKAKRCSEEDFEMQKDLVSFRYLCESDDLKPFNVCVVLPHPKAWDLAYIKKPNVQIDRYAYIAEGSTLESYYQKSLAIGYTSKLKSCCDLFVYLAAKSSSQGLFSIEDDIEKIPWSLTKKLGRYLLEGYQFDYDELSQQAIESHSNKVAYILTKLCPDTPIDQTFIILNQDNGIISSVDDLVGLDYSKFFLVHKGSNDGAFIETLQQRIIHFETAFCRMSWIESNLLNQGIDHKKMNFTLNTISDEFTI